MNTLLVVIIRLKTTCFHVHQTFLPKLLDATLVLQLSATMGMMISTQICLVFMLVPSYVPMALFSVFYLHLHCINFKEILFLLA